MRSHLIDGFRKGDLEPVYREIFPGMLNYSKKYINPAYVYLAEDYVQNAILLAWERRTKFGSINELKSFLYTTIRNQIISLYRKDKAKVRYESQLENEPFFQNSIVDQEVKTMLYNAINSLPEKEKLIFEMSFIDGLKNISIAEILDVSESTVQKQKASALRLLKKKIGSPNLSLLLFICSQYF